MIEASSEHDDSLARARARDEDLLVATARDPAQVIRRNRLFGDFDLASATVLEFGALHRPLAIGPNVFYADHLDTSALQEKYRIDPAVDKDAIVPVHYVLDGSPLVDVVGGKTFDAVVASHVIEHIPDVIGWLEELHAILRPGGRVFLYIPDGRFCFDYLRPATTAGQLLDAYLQKRRRPSPGTVLDSLGMMHHRTAAELWRAARSDTSDTAPVSQDVWQLARTAEAGAYHDSHCHVFTPAAFFRALALLIEGDVIGFSVVDFADTKAGDLEFVVVLERSDLPPGPERRAALRATLPAVTEAPDANAVTRARLFEALDRAHQFRHDERVEAAHRLAGAYQRADHYRDVIETLRQETADLRRALSDAHTAREDALATLRKVRWAVIVRLLMERIVRRVRGA